MQHSDLPDAGRVSHFEIDGQLPTPREKAALVGDPVPPGDANRYLTQNHAAGDFDGFANPTASVGLVAVNGVATTATRSDGAPALDQAITPTWAGLHTYGAGLAVSAGQGIAMADGAWIGGGAGVERIVFDLGNNRISLMGAYVGIGTLLSASILMLYHNVANATKLLSIRNDKVGATGATVSVRQDGTGDILELKDGAATVFAVLDGGFAGSGTGTPDRQHHVEVSDAVTAAVTYGRRLSHTTSGAAAPLFGVGGEDELEDAGGVMQVASERVTLWATATAGAESPLWRVSTYPAGSVGPGYGGFWTWDGVDGNVRTVIPNGAGDVAKGGRFTFCIYLDTAAAFASGSVEATPGGGAVDLYNVGGDQFTLTVAADGSVSVVRAAGADTADIVIWPLWIN